MPLATPLRCIARGIIVPTLIVVARGATLADVAPIGDEFVANTYTFAAQEEPAVGTAANGDFVIAWESFGQLPGQGGAIFAQRFTSDGTPAGTEFQVSMNAPGTEYQPSAASSAAGDFVIAWAGVGVPGGDNYEIVARRYASDGTALGTEIVVNTYTTSRQERPSVAAAANGDFVVVWQSPQDGGLFGVFGRRFASDGSPIGGEFQVNTYTTYNQFRPVVAASPNFEFVVAWYSREQDGEVYGIFAQRFGSDGSPLGSEFQVNSQSTGNQRAPSVSMAPTGDFVIAWEQDTNTASIFDVVARRFASDGTPLGADFPVNTYTTLDQVRPSVQLSSSLDFVVAWHSEEQEGGFDEGIFAQCFASDGSPLGSEFQVNTYTTAAQWRPRVGPMQGDSFVIAWGSGSAQMPYGALDGRDGDLSGVSVRRFSRGFACSPSPLACDSPGKSVLALKKKTGNPEKSALVWKWLNGTIAAAGAFGDPTQTTNYALCVYDDGALAQQHAIAGGGTCGTKPCWNGLKGATGYKYVNKAGNGAGIKMALLKSDTGKAKIVVRGRGPNLPVPASDPLFDQSQDVVVQLQSSDAGCWEAVFPTPAVKNTAEKFNEKIP